MKNQKEAIDDSNVDTQGPSKAITPRVRWALISVNMVVAVDVLALLLILPIVDTLAQKLGASKGMVGTLFTVYSVCAIMSSFVMGKISDLYGRRTIFLISATGSLCSSIAAILVTNFTEFLIATAFSGCFTGTVSTAYAYVSDVVTDPTLRSKHISYTTATLACCLVLGPLVGGLVSVLTVRAPFYISGSLALTELLLVYGFLKNPTDLIESSPSSTTYSPLSQADTHTETEVESSSDPEARSTHQSMFLATDISRSGAEMESLAAAAASSPFGGESSAVAIAADPLDMTAEENREEDGEEERRDTTQPLLSPAESPADTDASHSPPVWRHPRALIVGGLGVFLNTATYLGLVALTPLLLQEHSFHLVDDDNSGNDDDLSDSEIAKVNFTMGTLLGVYGAVQVISILKLFPLLHKRLGLLYTAATGCFIYGASFCTAPLIHHLAWLYILFAATALGNGLSRPAFPAFLSLVAPPARKAEYLSLTATAGNLAMVCGGQLTLLYAFQPLAAILVAGGLSVGNALILGLYALHYGPEGDGKRRARGDVV